MIVLTPKRLSAKALEKLVEERLPWAEARLAEKEAEYEKHGLPKTYLGGETFPFLGRDIPLVVVETGDVKRTRCELSGDRLFVKTPPAVESETAEPVRRALLKWYRAEADKEIHKRVVAWTPVIGKAPASVSIRNQKARWGSCSVNGTINFNWRLVMAAPGIIDYVVVHELCHLLEHNHSAAYWELVEKALPEYRNSRKALRALAYYLEIG